MFDPSRQRACPLLVVKLSKVTVELAARVVKAPLDLVVAPIDVPLIVPPLIATLLAERLFAVTAPKTLTVSSAEPMLIASATVSPVPILMIFPALPVPILIVLALSLVPRLTVPVVPESSVKAFAPVEVIVPSAAKPRLFAEVLMVSRVETPVRSPVAETLSPPFDVSANVPVVLPIAMLPVPAVAMFTLAAPVVPRSVLPLEERVVNAPDDCVSVPIAVPLIPVAVVLKLPDVIVRSLTPALMLDADSPERVSVPDVAVKLSAPVVCVKPFDAVSKPAEVIVPVLVVAIFPVVDNVPFSLIVKVFTPSD